MESLASQPDSILRSLDESARGHGWDGLARVNKTPGASLLDALGLLHLAGESMPMPGGPWSPPFIFCCLQVCRRGRERGREAVLSSIAREGSPGCPSEMPITGRLAVCMCVCIRVAKCAMKPGPGALRSFARWRKAESGFPLHTHTRILLRFGLLNLERKKDLRLQGVDLRLQSARLGPGALGAPGTRGAAVGPSLFFCSRYFSAPPRAPAPRLASRALVLFHSPGRG